MSRIVGALVIALAFLAGSPQSATAQSARAASSDGLSGTWQVTRTCLSGCIGSVVQTEVVQPVLSLSAVHSASGGATLLLYTVGKRRILVHGASASTVLVIVSRGRTMRGRGIDVARDTFLSTWVCTAPPASLEALVPKQDLKQKSAAQLKRARC